MKKIVLRASFIGRVGCVGQHVRREIIILADKPSDIFDAKCMSVYLCIHL